MLSLLESSHRVAIDLSDFDFLRLFRVENEEVQFRMWNEKTKRFPKELNCKLNAQEYSIVREELLKYQKSGYGVYFVVHSGGKSGDDINRINAFMLDADFGKYYKRDKKGNLIYQVVKNRKMPITLVRTPEETEKFKSRFWESLKKFSINPTVVLETKNGFHIYWCVRYAVHDKVAREQWKKIESALIRYFQKYIETDFYEHIDESVNMLAKVMRVNRFMHLKNPSEPFQIKCIYLNENNKYTKEQIMQAVNYTEEETVTEVPIDIKTEAKPKKCNYANQSENDVIKALRSIDLRAYLGVNPKGNFICIFHDDKSPSASISFQNGEYRYWCHSTHSGCIASGHGLDIIDIVKAHQNCDTYQAIRCLKKEYGIKSEWETSQINIINRNIEIINDIIDNENANYKNLRKMLTISYIYLLGLYQECIDKLHEYFTINDENLLFVSNQKLADKLHKKVDKTNQYINLMCVLGLVKKVRYKDLDKRISDRAVSMAEKKHRNGICFYNVPKLSEGILQIADERAEKMYECGFSIKGFSRIFVSNVFGEEYADMIYQVKFECTERNKAISDFIAHTICKSIENYGYFAKDMLYAANKKQSKRKRIGQDKLEYEYRRILPAILSDYDLALVKKPREIKALGFDIKKNILVKRS